MRSHRSPRRAPPACAADARAASQGYRRILLGYLNPKAGVTVTGFKETRWSWNIKLKDGDLLVETFPCARMIINYRENVESQLESGFYKNDNPAAKLMPAEHLLSFNKELLAFEARHPANTFRMTTEMMSAENLNKLIAWLGYPHCKVAGAVRANVNSTYSQLPVEGEPFKHVKCGT